MTKAHNKMTKIKMNWKHKNYTKKIMKMTAAHTIFNKVQT